MAKINTTRREAAIYNGRTVDFVRVVGPDDGPAFNEATPMIIVSVDGNELSFFANEVVLSEEEKEGAEQALDERSKKWDEAQKRGAQNVENKKKLFAEGNKNPIEAGADRKEKQDGDREGGKDAPPEEGDGIAAHRGVSAETIEANRNPQNRVPSSPPLASNPGTAPQGSPQEEPGETRKEGRTPLDQLPGGIPREQAKEIAQPDNPAPAKSSNEKLADKAGASKSKK